jgi:hypothetical protein
MLIESGNEARQHGEAFSLGDFWAPVLVLHVRELAVGVAAAPRAGCRPPRHEASAVQGRR